MRSAGIICEYNPIHNGHERQISELRRRGVDTVVCLMSGNAVQRGSFACTDKYTRASAALRTGADLVLELPFPYCMSSAEYFAAAAMRILSSVGVDEVNFGSECGSIDRLTRAAEVLDSPEYELAFKRESAKTRGAMRAMTDAFRAVSGEELPGGSNDLLGIAYIRAKRKLDLRPEPTVIRRCGSGYRDETVTEGEYPSATALRRMIDGGDLEGALKLMPCGAAEVFRRAADEGLFPTLPERAAGAVLGYFRLLADGCDASEWAECGGGAAYRLRQAARDSVSLESFFKNAHTEPYTESRIRRAAFFSVTGTTPLDLTAAPKYTTLLAANRRGREFLRAVESPELEIVTKPSRAPECRQRLLSRRLDAIFNMTLPIPRPETEFERRSPEILEND